MSLLLINCIFTKVGCSKGAAAIGLTLIAVGALLIALAAVGYAFPIIRDKETPWRIRRTVNAILLRLIVVFGIASLASCAFLDDAPPVTSIQLGGIGVLPNLPTASPKDIVVFGDSLSDAGNSHVGSLHIRAPSPPYYFGRFSNGPVWVELFAAHFGLDARAWLRGGTNFAIGGARVGTGMDSLPNQLQVYLLGNLFSPLDKRTLYVIYGGGNDIRVALQDADPAPALAHAAFSIRLMIERLAKKGAVDFLVPNVPNRGRAPAAQARGVADKETAMTLAFNRGLDLALADLPSRYQINLVRVDFWTAAETTFLDPAQRGFANATDPCMVPVKDGGPPENKICADPDRYVFWDDIHPTFAGHRVLAMAAIAAWETGSRPSSLGSAGKPSGIDEDVLRLVRDYLGGEQKDSCSANSP
jgi:outer membrane lipase/esterase